MVFFFLVLDGFGFQNTTLRKKAGEDFEVGKADQYYFSVGAMDFVYAAGNKDFHYFDDRPSDIQKCESDINGEVSVGGTIAVPLFCLAVTVEVGFDWDYCLKCSD